MKENEPSRRDCFAELGSVTYAMKAQEALSAAAIPCRVIKQEAASSRRGCTYGIGFSCQQKNNVRFVLDAAGISVRRWGEDG